MVQHARFNILKIVIFVYDKVVNGIRNLVMLYKCMATSRESGHISRE